MLISKRAVCQKLVATVCETAVDIQWSEVSTRARHIDCLFMCTRWSETELFNDFWRQRLFADGETLRISSLLLVLKKKKNIVLCLIPPLAHVFYCSRQEREAQRRFEASRSWKWNVFWSRFSDLGTVSFLQRPACADVWWLMTAEPSLLRRDQTASKS